MERAQAGMVPEGPDRPARSEGSKRLDQFRVAPDDFTMRAHLATSSSRVFANCAGVGGSFNRRHKETPTRAVGVSALAPRNRSVEDVEPRHAIRTGEAMPQVDRESRIARP